MEFWGVEVKPGETVKCEPGEEKYLHLTQASLGESKDKVSENIPIFIKVNDQKLVLGTLSAENCCQIAYDLIFQQEFELSHSAKNSNVYFLGYKAVIDMDGPSDDDGVCFDSDCDSDHDLEIGQHANGKPRIGDEQGKSVSKKVNAGKEENSASKAKAKITELLKAAEPTSDDEDDDEDDDDEDEEDGSEEETDGDEDMESESDDEDMDESSEEDEATPKKTVAGKKRPAESASKASVPEKKAKIITPAKQVGKAGDGGKTKQQTPKSSGSVKCKSCSKTFNSDNALQAHSKAKHSGAK